jgi:hypothetical protein
MEQGTNVFGNGAISAFRDASLLVGVMDTELVLGSFHFAVRNKISPKYSLPWLVLPKFSSKLMQRTRTG